MNNISGTVFGGWIEETKASKEDFIVAIIDRILRETSMSGASDLHFQPGRKSLEIRFRLDGVLHPLGELSPEYAPRIAARLKVLAELLTYQVSTPQEGRVRPDRLPGVSKEIRISTAPTLFGERIAVRFFSEETQLSFPEQLGFPNDIQSGILDAIGKNGGAVLLCGPAGSGKTTTAYALLRELALRGENLRSIITLEDPVEHVLDHVAQIEVSSRSELPLGEMIKYMLRQDPEVLFVGEIRDLHTAQTALQAALSGHLLLSTFHAGSAVEALGRLREIGIEPFVLRSGISYVLCQRLLRKLCSCAKTVHEPLKIRIDRETFQSDEYKIPQGCSECGGTGYQGRILISESLPLENEELMRNLLEKREVQVLQESAIAHGMIPLAQRAFSLLESGITSPLEIDRIFGIGGQRS